MVSHPLNHLVIFTLYIAFICMYVASVLIQPSELDCFENQQVVIDQIYLDYLDFKSSASEGLFKVTLSCLHCKLFLNPLSSSEHGSISLQYSKGDVFGSSLLQVIGPLAGLQTALAKVVYVPFNNYSGPDNILIKIEQKDGGKYLDAGSTAVIVKKRNSFPKLVVQADTITAKVHEQVMLNVTLLDVRPSTSEDMTITAMFGNISSSFGVCLLNSCKFSGHVSQAMVSSLMYISNNPVLDHVNFTLQLVDGVKVFQTVRIIVSRPQLATNLNIPSDKTIDEDTMLSINGIKLDSSHDYHLDMILNCSNGKLSFLSNNMVSIITRNTSFIHMRGSAMWINRNLQSLTYTPNVDWNGQELVSVVVSSQFEHLTLKSQFFITVLPIPEDPVLLAPYRTIWGYENSDLRLTNITLSDPDDLTNQSYIKLNILVEGGNIKVLEPLEDIKVLSITQQSIILVATVKHMNVLLSSKLFFVPNRDFNYFSNEFGQVSIFAEKYDPVLSQALSGNKVISFRVFVEPVSLPPVVSVPIVVAGFEDVPLRIPNITIKDTHSNSQDGYSLQFICSRGKFSFISYPVDVKIAMSISKSELFFNCPSVDICNVALASILYTPLENWHGEDVVELTVIEGSTTIKESFILSYSAVNDAPEIKVPIYLTGQEDTDLSLKGIEVDDVDFMTSFVPSAVLQVNVSCILGELYLFGDEISFSSISNEGFSSFHTFIGRLNGINNALQTLKFRPPHNFFGIVDVTLSVSDLGHYAEKNNDPLVTVQSVSVLIMPVMDAVFVVTSRELSTLAHTSMSFDAVTLRSVDDAREVMKLAINCSTCELSYTGDDLVISRESSSSIVYIGTVETLSLALSSTWFLSHNSIGGIEPISFSLSSLQNDQIVPFINEHNQTINKLDIVVNTLLITPTLLLTRELHLSKDIGQLLQINTSTLNFK